MALRADGHILLCGTDRELQGRLGRALRDCGRCGHEAFSLEQARTHLAQHPIALVIMDEEILHPETLDPLDGILAAGQRRPLVILILSDRESGAEDSSRLRARCDAVRRVMRRPLSSAELLLHVDALFGERSTTRELSAVGSQTEQQPLAPSSRESDAREMLINLRASYVAKLPGRLEELIAAIGTSSDRSSTTALEQARLISHRMRGTAGSYGLSVVGAIAGEIEDRLLALLSDNADGAASRREIDRGLERLGEEIARAVGETVSMSAAAAVGAGESSTSGDDVAGTPLLLLVSDDEFFSHQLRQVARRGLVTLVLASNVDEALACARQRHLDAALIDVTNGEERGGLEIARRLRLVEGLDALALAFVSADGALRSRVAATQVGAALFLTKPVVDHDLSDAIRQLCDEKGRARSRLLLVDDEPEFGEAVSALLANEHFDVHVLTEAESIVETLDELRPDLLLLDLVMPGVSGFDLCRIVRANPKWQMLPVLVLTALGSEDARLEAFEAGADDYLLKPVVKSELLTRIRLRLDHSRLVRERSSRDWLTGMLTRQAFVEAFTTRLARAQRNQDVLSLCMLDVDQFKRINDVHGHLAGDRVLGGLGRVLAARFRDCDLRGRWGGEEFVMALSGVTATEAGEILSRLQDELGRQVFQGETGQDFHATFSAGIGTYPDDGTTLEELIQIADRRLYGAKRAGRNRVFSTDDYPAVPQASA